MNNIIITGGAGFIGSNFVNYWVKTKNSENIVILDSLTYAGCISSIQQFIDSKKIKFFKGDINDRKLVDELLNRFDINYLINFAAESHVDKSIEGPSDFINTNILGTYNLLEAFKDYWEAKNKPNFYRFLHVSTDEVFGSLKFEDAPFSEKSLYKPSSPYSASKAASDHLVKAWGITYGIPILISNCSNNYGPYHFPEKLIPLTIKNIFAGKPIRVYGNGENIRDWLYVEDHCRALEKILLNGSVGETYCIGGGNEISNIDLVKMLTSTIDKCVIKFKKSLPIIPSEKLIEFVDDRLGHDLRYAINYTKLKEELGWEPITNFKEGIEKTVEWFIKNPEWLEGKND